MTVLVVSSDRGIQIVQTDRSLWVKCLDCHTNMTPLHNDCMCTNSECPGRKKMIKDIPRLPFISVREKYSNVPQIQRWLSDWLDIPSDIITVDIKF